MLKFKKSNSFKILGFSLAEVIIVIGIIGIIAESTIPSLVNDFKKQVAIVQLKETYSILNNALNNAKVENGNDINSWSVPTTSVGDASEYFAKTYLLPYMQTNGGQICGRDTSSQCVFSVKYLDNLSTYTMSGDSNVYSFVLANGAIVSVAFWALNGPTIDSNRVAVFFDINGKKSPNILGKDTFIVELGADGSGNKNKFLPYMINGGRSTLFNSDGNACNKTNGKGYYCFAIIMQDGWKISDDYPWN